ncbi:MAG: aldolase [Clostridia bacterium]|nr:aldolase [Clostridia bacterium]
MDMRKSRVLKKIRNGETAFSFKLNLSDARAAEIAAMTGIDCLWTDMEHVPNDYAAIENIIRAAKIYDVDVLTRVKRGSYNDMINPLEADSTGIMIPHLMSLEEAKRVVYYTKFYPIGRRPIDGGNADGNYCLTDGNEYMKQANEERFNVVQIEDPEPLKDLDAICELEGIDMIFFGPADFSQGIGKPNDFSNPELMRVKELIAKTARKNGKMAGTVGGAGNYQQLESMGYNFINLGADVVGLSGYYLDIMSKIKG